MKKSLILICLLVSISMGLLAQTGISGDLIIFHAGSLSVPMKELAKEFKKLHPKVNILLESAGSVESARKITDLKKPCDIMASADYKVIDKMLIPQYSDWNIKFVSNEMCIVYSEKSRYANQINNKNWFNILLKDDVAFGRADPNSDPCGYRSVMTMQLAEKYYKQPNLVNRLTNKDNNYIRPKEVDQLALLESQSVDYVFLYKSVAIQHHLKFLILPDEINLKLPKFTALYNTAIVPINGKEPGQKELMKGEPMIYGVTLLKTAPNKPAALAFLTFMLSKDNGMKILEKDGQPSVIPQQNPNYEKIPAELKPFVKK
ncbi:MAG: tungstate ABC transporter substrate-binding protein WtpA [Bacteroidales bacterium]|nr:tungstate ABC transporter substrate-binding protein WtpA [Bacteroidales bacterium]MDD4603921.1 tungstate ABC transporter substrate-binding protein WtpA [Bacteroidales bacterium]